MLWCTELLDFLIMHLLISISGEYEGLKHLGIHQHRAPKSPEYSTYEARMRSFENWPPSIHQKPHQLADAGFYFTGRFINTSSVNVF